MANVQAYPLAWPIDTPRTKMRVPSQFKRLDWDHVIQELIWELERLGASNVVMSSNRPVSRRGRPMAPRSMKDESDPGVAVYFTLNGQPTCFPCDKFQTMAENLRAITLTIDSLRALDRYGVGKSGQAFTAFKALPANAGEAEDWRTVLGLGDNATAEQVRNAHRVAAASAHPDRGGSSDQMARINTARDRALAELEGGRS